jgi:Aminoglycoside-2''-adenylyltransferase
MTAIVPDWKLWDPWRPEQIADFLAGLAVPWYVAAGWAIDLFHGEERREHEDLEIAVPNARFGEVAGLLEGFEVFVITAPQEATPLADAWGQLEDTHQTWVREPGSSSWRFDLFREPSEGDSWICRREPTITMPYGRLIERTPDGIPYGRPEVILLFKAKHARMEKNRADFADTLPLLGEARRVWLRDALERVHPGHEWLEELAR